VGGSPAVDRPARSCLNLAVDDGRQYVDNNYGRLAAEGECACRWHRGPTWHGWPDHFSRRWADLPCGRTFKITR
jgi:hypothetical protein